MLQNRSVLMVMYCGETICQWLRTMGNFLEPFYFKDNYPWNFIRVFLFQWFQSCEYLRNVLVHWLITNGYGPKNIYRTVLFQWLWSRQYFRTVLFQYLQRNAVTLDSAVHSSFCYNLDTIPGVSQLWVNNVIVMPIFLQISFCQ